MNGDRDWSELRSGAMPGFDSGEQEEWAVRYGGVPSDREAARIADRVLEEPRVAERAPGPNGWREKDFPQPNDPPPRRPVSGIKVGYSDPRLP